MKYYRSKWGGGRILRLHTESSYNQCIRFNYNPTVRDVSFRYNTQDLGIMVPDVREELV